MFLHDTSSQRVLALNINPKRGKKSRPARTVTKFKEDSSLLLQLTDLVGTVRDKVVTWGRWPLRMVGVVVLSAEQMAVLSPEQSRLLKEAGNYLHELRELAGLTSNELADALDVEDRSIMDALEQGTATLSFELILRLSSILARHDPLPFVIRMVRTYDPDVWQFLHDWGIGRIPLQYERERSFVNIMRSRDQARSLTDEEFASLVKLADSAFDLGLQFIVREKVRTEAALKKSLPDAEAAREAAKDVPKEGSRDRSNSDRD
ncbi:Hypothetical protein HDN1F_14130 [gamma proteobacterium HdN1]|nr:Hypothetical protein HDN1F_14130 [gamma proteobacterium HdN1]